MCAVGAVLIGSCCVRGLCSWLVMFYHGGPSSGESHLASAADYSAAVTQLRGELARRRSSTSQLLPHTHHSNADSSRHYIACRPKVSSGS